MRRRSRSALAVFATATALTAAGCSATDGGSAPSGAAESAGSGGRASPGRAHAERPPTPQPPGSARTPGQRAPQDDRSRQPSHTTPASPDGSPGGTDRSANSPGSRAPWCSAESLSPVLRAGDSGAGQRYAVLVVTNTSSTACRTQGWPGLQLNGGEGEKLPTTVVRDHGKPARQLTLGPDRTAWSRLHWTVVPGNGGPDEGGCPTPASASVTVPGQHAAASVPWKQGSVCDAGRIRMLPLTSKGGPPQ